MEIILGVFYTDTFRHIKDWHNVEEFEDFYNFQDDMSPYYRMFTGKYDCPTTIAQVYKASVEATKIHFCLDKLMLPLNQTSVTCAELEMLMEKQLIGKVQFWLNKRKVSTEKVLALIETVKAEQLTFDHINFESI